MVDTNQKALALNALGWHEFAIKIRDNGEWYAVCGAEIRDGPVLVSTFGNGATPSAAIDALWDRVTCLPPGQYLVMKAGTAERRAVRWNGFMWAHVDEPQRDAA